MALEMPKNVPLVRKRGVALFYSFTNFTVLFPIFKKYIPVGKCETLMVVSGDADCRDVARNVSTVATRRPIKSYISMSHIALSHIAYPICNSPLVGFG